MPVALRNIKLADGEQIFVELNPEVSVDIYRKGNKLFLSTPANMLNKTYEVTDGGLVRHYKCRDCKRFAEGCEDNVNGDSDACRRFFIPKTNPIDDIIELMKNKKVHFHFKGMRKRDCPICKREKKVK